MINQYILNPIIILLFTVALLVFFWGILQFIAHSASEEGRQKGKSAMDWGIKGLFVMMVVYALIRIVLNSFGIPLPSYLGF